jgi:DHA3 family macrolide efflux protein-like MFS transporter
MPETLPQNWQKNFYLIWGGQFVATITTTLVQFSLIWYLTALSHNSATMLAYGSIVGFLPAIFLSPFVGSLIDRYNKKYILIATDMFVALSAVIIAIFGLIDTIPMWLVFVALFVRSLGSTFTVPTLNAITPTIVPNLRIAKINGQIGTIQAVSYILAPGLAAVAFDHLAMPDIMFFNVVGAVFGSGALLLANVPKLVRDAKAPKPHFMKETSDGLKAIWSNKGMFQMVLLNAFFTLVVMPAASLYPIMTRVWFHGTFSMAGIVEVVYAGGMFIGGVLMSVWGGTRNKFWTASFAVLLAGISMILQGVLPRDMFGFYLFLLLNVFFGIAWPVYSAIYMALFQEQFKADMLGRVLSVATSISSLAGPVGLMLVGPGADALGVEWIFILSGIGLVLMFAMMLALPKVRHVDARNS